MPGNNELDFELRDYRTLTPEQWEIVRRQVLRRAELERAKALHRLFGGLWFGLETIAAVLAYGAHRLTVRAAVAAAGWWRAHRDRRRRRMDIARLHALSDRDLKDMGVKRSEIHWVVHHGREYPGPGPRAERPHASRPDPNPVKTVTAPEQKKRVNATAVAA